MLVRKGGTNLWKEVGPTVSSVLLATVLNKTPHVELMRCTRPRPVLSADHGRFQLLLGLCPRGTLHSLQPEDLLRLHSP